MKGLLFAILSLPLVSHAKLVTKTIEYKDGDTLLEGFYAYDDKIKGARPGVVVVHNWMGVSDETKKRVSMLADLGYAAFAADIYGKGVRPKDAAEAGQMAGRYKSNVSVLRARAQAALTELSKQSLVNKNKIAATGYCFGGTTALELARSGAPLVATVSFHGGLATPSAADAKNIKGKILVLHGADDPYVPANEVDAFEKEMREAKVDWQLIAYGNSVHAFTEKGAGNDNSKGAAYNEKADRRSWEAMKNFFAETF